MESPRFHLLETISKIPFFKLHLERLLSHLHPWVDCAKIMTRVIVHGPAGSGKSIFIREAAQTLGRKLYEERVTSILDDNVVATDQKIRAFFSKLCPTEPCIIYLSGLETLSYLEDRDLEKVELSITESLDDLSKSSTQPIIFIAGTDDFHRLNKTSLIYLFHQSVGIPPLTIDEANFLFMSVKREAKLESDLSSVLFRLFNEEREYYLGNLLDAIAKAEVCHHTQLTNSDQDNIDEEEKDAGTRWLDVGGLGDIKNEIIDAIQLSIEYPQLRKSGLRRTGILLFGPPGTGKTLLAKAVATECNLKFFNVKGPELLNEYVGQSEENVRSLFKKACHSSPSVIFFDEIDSLAPKRGHAGDSGGVMDTLVSQLLAEFDNASKCDGVSVIAATNRVDLVDPSLLRPGRFDKVLEVPLPKTSADRLQILEALTRKMKLAEDVDLAEIETMAKAGMSGADFQGLCSRALHKSFDRSVRLVEAQEASEEEVQIVTCREDFLNSLEELSAIYHE